MLCVAKNNSEYVEVTPVEVVQPTLQEKSITITENGTTEVVADSGYDGLAKVSVEANVQDNHLLNAIKALNSYDKFDKPFELTADMFDENSIYINKYRYASNRNIISAEIPDNIVMIRDSAFFGCDNMEKIYFGTGLTTIENYAFDYCRVLKEIYIQSIEQWLNISFSNERANPIFFAGGTTLFVNGQALIDLVVPKSITAIRNYAFRSYKKLNSILFENNSQVTSIGSYAFNGCGSLTSVTIPDSVTIIRSNAFRDISSLTNLTIGNGVTTIEGYVFYGCSKIKTVKLSNITSIGTSAFYRCSALSSVDFRGVTQVPTIQSDSFNYVPTTCKFIIPDELYDSWIVATNWASLYAKGYQFIKASEYTEA